MIDLSQLQKEAASVGVTPSEAQLVQFDTYAALLLEWSEKMNLTAIKKPEEIVTKHFVDSLTLLTAIEVPKGARLIDVGTGAGFPAVPLKIMRPDLRVTLLDGLNKRLKFLDAVGEALGQTNECVHARAEEAAHKNEYREQFDIATARAVAHLRELGEFCLPFVKLGGVFAAMKSGEIDAEWEEAKGAIRLLGGRLEEIRRLTLPDGSARSIVIIRKISQLSTKYPRPHAKIAKFPLK